MLAFFKLTKQLFAILMLSGCIVIMDGCVSKKSPQVTKERNLSEIPNNKSPVEKAVKTTPVSVTREAARLESCEKELDILKGVSPQRYTLYKRKFDGLMGGAAQYSGLRNQVNPDIQETVDALYRYKVNHLCAEVGQVVLTGLIERGEQFK